MKYGFVKTITAVPRINVGDCHGNAQEIISVIDKATKNDAELVLLPELCLTGGTCGDLFKQPFFTAECEKAIANIAKATKKNNTIIVVGAPIMHNGALYNCSVIMYRGIIAGVTTKNKLQGNECRYFTTGTTLPKESRITVAGQETTLAPRAIFKTPAYSFAIETGHEAHAPQPIGATLACAGAEIILNPACENEEAGRHSWLRSSLTERSHRYKCGYLHANSGWGESTSNAVYSGYAAIAECGTMLADSERFLTNSHTTVTEIDVERIRKERIGDASFTQASDIPYIYIAQEADNNATLTRTIDPTPFIPAEEERDSRFSEIFMIQATALARRIEHTRSKSAVIGISGGLDSTLALLVTAKAFDILEKPHSDIIAITMPGFGTSGRTYFNALSLMKHLGTTIKEISIKEACLQHFADIGHDTDNHDVTYENSQARERTQILMDIANQQNGIVVGTGDLSELALGWATYNGDHMSMYSVNASVPKTLMQHIVRWIAFNSNNDDIRSTLLDIVDTPISPELTPADNQGNIKQKTEDLVGPYELHDFYLYNFIRYGYSPEKIHALALKAFEGRHDSATIKKWLTTFMRRFFTQQFKRSCMPDGPKVGSCHLGADGWSMPSDVSPAMFANLCNGIGE